MYLSSGTFTISGSPVVSGNRAGSEDNNVYLSSGRFITVGGGLDADRARIGFVTDRSPTNSTVVDITSSFDGMSVSADSFVHEGSPEYTVKVKDNKVVLSYEASANVKAAELEYSGQAQVLVTCGKVIGGAAADPVVYAIGTDGITAPGRAKP